MRLKQWIKNLLIFVSMFTSSSFSYDNFFSLLYIFVSFSLVVSSTYIFNDFTDIDTDSRHPTKSSRPIAAGKISKKNGFTFMFFLFLLGNLTLYFLDSRLILFSFLYTVITYSYSKKLKYIKYVDISVIAVLFVLRIVIGSFATSVPTSTPLILFVFFISLGIAAGKKLSIMKNDLVTDSNVKDFLIISYSEDNLLVTLKSTLQLSDHSLPFLIKNLGRSDGKQLILINYFKEAFLPALTSIGRSRFFRASFLRGRFSSSTAPVNYKPKIV